MEIIIIIHVYVYVYVQVVCFLNQMGLFFCMFQHPHEEVFPTVFTKVKQELYPLYFTKTSVSQIFIVSFI